jgi:sterol desaturase/sphingolipid hydroxylase (fatty acid hydroxylase superfamily)
MKLEIIVTWFFALAGGLALCGARLSWLLFRMAPDPPEESIALRLWQRKRQWVVISELAVLPAFATIAVLIGRLQQWPVEAMVLMTMTMGGLGFAFFLDALQVLVRRRMGMDERP